MIYDHGQVNLGKVEKVPVIAVFQDGDELRIGIKRRDVIHDGPMRIRQLNKFTGNFLVKGCLSDWTEQIADRL